MNARLASLLRPAAAGCLVATLAGCSLFPEPKPDPTRFFVLTTSASGAAAAAVSSSPALLLRPVEVAGYLRNPPLVVRRGDNEIEFRDYARWGESLEQGIGRVLSEELRARGVAVTLGAGRDRAGSERHLNVRVLACEGTAAGGVEFRVAWEIAKPGATAASAGGEFRATGLRWDGKSEATLAASLSEAVAALAAEIAAAPGAR